MQDPDTASRKAARCKRAVMLLGAAGPLLIVVSELETTPLRAMLTGAESSGLLLIRRAPAGGRHLLAWE